MSQCNYLIDIPDVLGSPSLPLCRENLKLTSLHLFSIQQWWGNPVWRDPDTSAGFLFHAKTSNI